VIYPTIAHKPRFQLNLLSKSRFLSKPRIYIKGLPEEELTFKQIIRLGIYQHKVERAIQLYRNGVGSLGYIAEHRA